MPDWANHALLPGRTQLPVITQPGGVWAAATARPGWLHGPVDHGQQLAVQGVQVHLVAEAGREPLDGAGGVVAATVEAPVDQGLDPGCPAARSRCRTRGWSPPRPRPVPTAPTRPAPATFLEVEHVRAGCRGPAPAFDGPLVCTMPVDQFAGRLDAFRREVSSHLRSIERPVPSRLRLVRSWPPTATP